MCSISISALLFLATTIPISSSLKCHSINYGNLSDSSAMTTSSSLQECPIGANSCSKTVDYSRNMFSKTCQIGNCTTSNGAAQAPANCFNSSSNGNIMSTCCCYGDGCNSSPTQTPYFSALIFLILGVFL